MQRVQGTVSENGETAHEVKRTASTLSTEAGTLSGEVKDFLTALSELGGGDRLLAYEKSCCSPARRSRAWCRSTWPPNCARPSASCAA
jgi:hypothetical protein